jgi:hypothetical protein
MARDSFHPAALAAFAMKGIGCPARVKPRKSRGPQAYIKFDAMQMENSTLAAR